MKKYNTPEMKVSRFDAESIFTLSGDFATYNAFVEEKGVTAFERDWDTLKSEINITF